MKKLFESFRKFLYKDELSALGIVKGAIVYDYELGEPPQVIRIEEIDGDGVKFSDDFYGRSTIHVIDTYDALMAVKNGEWIPSGKFELPSYFPKLDFPNKSMRIKTKEEVIAIVNKNPNYKIFLDNPKGTTKKFGGLTPKVLPFDYGEWPKLINPADNMGWDLIIVPSSNEKDKNLIPVGIVDYHADPEIWKKVGKKMNDDIENNSKIVVNILRKTKN